MINYAKSLPRDENGNVMQEYPAAAVSQTSWNVQNQVASSVISLNPNTTTVEVSAFGGQGAVLKWIPRTDTTQASVISSGLGLANFDHFIPAGAVRRFVVPRETAGTTAGQAGSVHGLYQRVAWRNAGTTATSILAIEY